ncbi:sensor histidine kinase [Siphonobacter sp. BAB-5385]|uniref:sensor histidine kinase n=1 Tax=unclassified Siphonobacter TaxID=2635712 RepID=UPI000B9E1AA0|nr:MULTISPECIES: histidine kinase [unclassified Siphonobacter]OZI05986.1 sensor histidine kinase [Siphonobacter sp. BAB-5385]PMD97349.1 sensor histidine kinase [Siphonobacter sp. BAB-5405]
MNDKEKTYWIFQLIGWPLWLSNDLLTYSLEFKDTENWVLVLNYVINIILSIFLTHQYRRYVKKHHRDVLDAPKALPQVLCTAFLFACIMTALNIPFDVFTTDLESPSGHFLSFLFFWGKPMLIWLILYHVFKYLESTREIAVEKVKLESLAKETEAKVLRAQLNPHFMFNALNSIRALILEDPDRAQKGITQLSNILRSSLLADRRQTVTLGEEMRTVDDYLALEKIRYEERLEVRRNVYPETINCLVPPMMLQTLVENAIKHGVSKPIKGGFVSIETRLQQNRLDIRISNTGILQDTESGGFGLKNTERRLKLLFGEEAEFKIYQSAKDVVCAEIMIPMENPKPKEAPVVVNV